MLKNKKQMYLVIGAFALVLLLGTTTYAFFNYTRTGTQNIIKTGRISFNSTQGTAMNLDNLFPIDTTVSGIMNDATKVGTVTINVTGDTTYSDGIEYLVSAVNVSNTIGSGANAKSLPISIDVSVTNNTNNDPATSLGTSDDDYFSHRGPSASTSIYKVLAGETISDDEQLLVGYIKSGATGVDGNVVIKAYIDKEKVGISDTYPTRTVRTVKTTGYSSNDCETVLTGAGVSGANASTYCDTASDLQDAIDNEDLTDAQISALVIAGIVDEYTDGTPASFGEDRTIFTTQEWNSLQQDGVSFQIKVEANEGTCVEEPVVARIATDVINDIQTLEITPYGKVYSGLNVDNYVIFNGEQWRILGVYTDSVNGDKLKIVRNEAIVGEDPNFGRIWNSIGNGNIWNGSQLETFLNSDYYNNLSNLSKNMIANGTWDVGACSSETPATGAYTCAHATTLSTKDINNNDVKVGLVSLYEYLYAAENDGICWITDGYDYDGGCADKDWLYSMMQMEINGDIWRGGWLITPSNYDNSSLYALNIATEGYVGSDSGAYGGEAVDQNELFYPVVYLKPEVNIIGGTGESTNPYRLSM